MTYIQYKRNELTKRLALLLIALAIIFIVIDTSYGLLSFSYPLYFSLIIAGASSYYLCIKGQQVIAAAIVLLAGYFVIFVFATDKELIDGISILFIPSVLAAVILFDAKRVLLRVVFCVVALSLFLLARYIDWDFFSYGPEPTLKYPVTFIIDFCASLLISIVLLQFVVGINTKVERKLLDNQQELHQLSSALKKNEARLLLANKGSRTGIYEWNTANENVFISEEWWMLLGYQVKDQGYITVDEFLDLLHPEDRDGMLWMIKRYTDLDKSFEMEIRRRTKTGEYLWFLDRGMITKEDENQRLSLIIGSTMDINERKINELLIQNQFGKLQETNRELDTFVYNAAHDLRSPLNAVLGLVSLAQETDSITEIRTYLANMERAVKVLDEFIIDISMYTQNAKRSVVEERVVIWELLQEVLETLQYSSWYKNIEIVCNVPKEIVVYTDKSRLRIVFANLISNAIKYQDILKEKQYVHIGVAAICNDIHFLIEDNGIGIDTASQEKIFDMFFRAYSKVEGSGLGLYITSEIIGKIEGRLFMASALGEGTSVKFVLPQKLAK